MKQKIQRTNEGFLMYNPAKSKFRKFQYKDPVTQSKQKFL